MEIAVVQEFLTRAGEMRQVMAADNAGERLLPAQRQTFQSFQEVAVNKGLTILHRTLLY
jgi:hypothetical protein